MGFLKDCLGGSQSRSGGGEGRIGFILVVAGSRLGAAKSVGRKGAVETMEGVTAVDQPAATTFVRDRATWLAYFMLGYFAYVESSLGPLMPSLREEFGISYTVASLHLSVFAAGSVLVGLIGERIAKRRGRRTIFWVAAGGYSCGAVLLVASPVEVGTIAAALVLGVFGGFLLLTIQAHLSDLHGARRAIAIAESNVAA